MQQTLIRAYFFLLLLSLIISPVTEVEAQKGIVEGQSLYMTGTIKGRSIYRNNRKIEFVEDNDTEVQTFYPADLKTVKFDGGDVYVSKVVEDDTVKTAYFLLQQIKGRANFYVLKMKKGSRFFGEKKGQFLELKDDESFRSNLAQVLNQCPGFEGSFPIVRRNRTSLARAFSLHNRCYKGAFPRVRYGFTIGYAGTDFEVQDNHYLYVSMRSTTPVLGAFIDFPTGLNPKWFANFQIQYQRDSYHTPTQSATDLHVNTTCLNLPLLLKYKSTAKEFRPYFVVGPTVSYLMHYESNLQEILNGTPYVRPLDNVSPVQLSLTAGVGTEISFSLKNSFGIEVRYSAGTGMRKDFNQRVMAWQVMGSVYF